MTMMTEGQTMERTVTIAVKNESEEAGGVSGDDLLTENENDHAQRLHRTFDESTCSSSFSSLRRMKNLEENKQEEKKEEEEKEKEEKGEDEVAKKGNRLSTDDESEDFSLSAVDEAYGVHPSSKIGSFESERALACLVALSFCSSDDRAPALVLDDESSKSLDSTATTMSTSSTKRSDRRPGRPALKRVASERSSSSFSVTFSSLEIREYDIALSDNPSCSRGPPIQLDWNYEEKECLPLDEYEEKRSPRCENCEDMILSHRIRKKLLLRKAGYSQADIAEAMKEVNRVKLERSMTEMLLPTSLLDEAVEDLVGKVKALFFGRV